MNVMSGPHPQLVCGQQVQHGVAVAQQGFVAEMAGNGPAAIACYDQAIAAIDQAIDGAGRHGVPVPDSVFSAVGMTHFAAARVKAAMGWGAFAGHHLQQALSAFHAAIGRHSGFAPHHLGAGAVLLALGDLPAAQQAFLTARDLDPTDPAAPYMLSYLSALQGQAAVAQHQYRAALRAAPGLPPIPAAAPSRGGGTDWLGAACKVTELVGNVVDLFGGIRGLM
jgi:tetratricopeptide (TPR) repeat protein